VDGLARAYLKRPVVFLQYDKDSPHATHRLDRFLAAWAIDKRPAEASPDTPHTMVDSGRSISYGERDYERDYRSMIDDEIDRAAGAVVHARRQMPNTTTLVVDVQVTNVTTESLHTPTNGATVHIVVYDGTKALKTGTDIQGTARATFDDPLPQGSTRQFSFTFDALRAASLSRSEAMAMVDYQPAGGQGRWDMLQAAVATTGELPSAPTEAPPPTAATTATATRRPTLTATPRVTPAPATETAAHPVTEEPTGPADSSPKAYLPIAHRARGRP
jgi:hypothetical protein